MPVDQAANPRIRTKVKKLDDRIDEEFYQITERLRADQINVEDYQAQILTLLDDLRLSTTFANDIGIARTAPDQHWLMRRHTDECRYTILFMAVGEGEVHPPHQHFNLISTQVVVEGHIHLREYDRVRYDENNQLVVEIVRDRILGPGETFQTSEWHRNVHWFCATDGPAVVFNINARGYENSTFDNQDTGPFGRRYLDPTNYDSSGLITCSHFDESEAEQRFQNKPLSGFPAPVPAQSDFREKTIAL
jgi:hypothetical protein